jgi:hypothetical protein
VFIRSYSFLELPRFGANLLTERLPWELHFVEMKNFADELAHLGDALARAEGAGLPCSVDETNPRPNTRRSPKIGSGSWIRLPLLQWRETARNPSRQVELH